LACIVAVFLFIKTILLKRFNTQIHEDLAVIKRPQVHLLPEENMKSDEEEIRNLAYQIWDSEGKPDGQSDKHWTQAKILVEGLRGIDQAGVKAESPSENPIMEEAGQPDQT
jgi:hypothetical protein